MFGCWKRVYRANQRLSTFFQVDLEVIRMMRSEDFSLGFAENVSKFVIFRRDIGKIRSLCKFCEVGLDVWRVKTELKLTKTWKFWCIHECCNTNNKQYWSCLEIDIEILDINMETMKSDDCKEVSGNDGDTNSMLVAM